MSIIRNDKEVKIHHIEVMGEPLGSVFNALWQELASLYWKWGEFVVLFGSKESRVELLNKTAPSFFRITQDALWESTILHIARLTDAKKSIGKSNLTIQRLPDLVNDPQVAQTISNLTEEAIKASIFCRDWRNRRFAHLDLDISLGEAVKPLEAASREKVNIALNAISNVLNAISIHYNSSETAFSFNKNYDGALSLLYVIDDGLQMKSEKLERVSKGNLLYNSIHKRDL